MKNNLPDCIVDPDPEHLEILTAIRKIIGKNFVCIVAEQKGASVVIDGSKISLDDAARMYAKAICATNGAVNAFSERLSGEQLKVFKFRIEELVREGGPEFFMPHKL